MPSAWQRGCNRIPRDIWVLMAVLAVLTSVINGLIQVSQQSMQMLSDDLHKQF